MQKSNSSRKQDFRY